MSEEQSDKELEAISPGGGSLPAAPTEPARDSRRFGRRYRIASAAVVVALLAVRIGLVIFGSPSSEPRALPSGEIVRDDFSLPDSGWESASGSTGSIGYAGGVYRIELNHGGEENAGLTVKGRSFNAIRVQADVRHTSGAEEVLGVDCTVRLEGSQSAFYLFLIMPASGEYLILRGSGSESVVLAKGLDQTFDAIHPGDLENTVAGECVTSGTRASLALTVNGVALADVQDPYPLGAFEGITLSVYAPTAAVATFDNARVDQLSGSASDRITAGASPQPPPPPDRGQEVIADSFNRPSTGWGAFDTPAHQLGYVSGSYRIYVKRPGGFWDRYEWQNHRYPSVSVQVKASVAGEDANGWLGVGCVVRTDPIVTYDFLVNPDSRGYQIIQITPRDTSIVTEGASAAVNPAGANEIRGDCTGNADGGMTSLVLYVNGEHVTSRELPSPNRFVGTGMYAKSLDDPIDARFGSIGMWVLP